MNIPAQSIQQIRLNPGRVNNIFKSNTAALPTTWTTIFTGRQVPCVITTLDFIATATAAITVQVRLLSPGSTGIELGQAGMTTDGDQIHFLDDGDEWVIDKGWGLQIQESTGATVHYVLMGYEYGDPT